jgi:hypothetical protein
MKKLDLISLNANSSLRWIRHSVALLAISAATASWAAPSVTYLASDLPDVVVGEDLWSFDYTITGPLASFESINLLFSPAKYGANMMVISNDPTLSPLITPPTLAPEADGVLSVTALDMVPTNGSAHLKIQFVWTSNGMPGPQPFEVLDDQFNVTSVGMTTPVPEMSPATLLLAGLMVMYPIHRRRRSA